MSGPGWWPDPSGRHRLRYNDGTHFTEYVSDNGEVASDPSGTEVLVSEHAMPVVEPGAVSGGPSFPPQRPAPFPGTSATPTPPKKRSLALGLVAGLAGLEAIAIIGLVVALTTGSSPTAQPIGSTISPSGSVQSSGGSVVYSSHFGPNENWPTGQVNSNTTVTLSNGQYTIQAWTQIHHPLVMPYSETHTAMSVEAAAADYSNSNISVGVGCQSGSGLQTPLVYQFAVYPDGQWYVEEARIPGGVQVLTSGETSPLGSSATVKLACSMKQMGTTDVTQLVAYVDGSRVGAIGDKVQGQIDGYLPILLVGSFGPTVHVTFTGVTVRRLTP